MKVESDRRLLWAVTGVFPDLFLSNATRQKQDLGISGVQVYVPIVQDKGRIFLPRSETAKTQAEQNSKL